MTSESQIITLDSPTRFDDDNSSSAYDTLIQTQRTLSLLRQDITRIPSDIARLQADLARIPFDIARRQSDLAHCLTREQRLIQDVEKQRRIVKSCSRIDKLFNEILAQVFLLLVHKDDIDDLSVGQSRNSDSNYPWRTAAVCKRWRAICMDTPKLWTYICWGKQVHFCNDSAETTRLYESRISMQLQLSKAAPLFITADIDCQCPTVTYVTQAVVAHAHRWKVADINSPSHLPPITELLRSIIPPGTRFTALEDLVWDASFEHLDIPFADYGLF